MGGALTLEEVGRPSLAIHSFYTQLWHAHVYRLSYCLLAPCQAAVVLQADPNKDVAHVPHQS